MDTNTKDPFFEDEEDLARSQAQAPAAKKPVRTAAASASAAPAQAAPGRKPPSFALVVVIAVVALLLGVALGYFWAMKVVGGPQAADTAATSTPLTSDDAAMPEGHPDMEAMMKMMNPDGTVNQEALDAYRAQRAAEQEAADAQDAA